MGEVEEGKVFALSLELHFLEGNSHEEGDSKAGIFGVRHGDMETHDATDSILKSQRQYPET